MSLDKSVVSRVVAALAREGLLDAARDPADERAKIVRVLGPRRLLEEWRLIWRRRHPRAERFDIGTRTVDQTLRAVADAQERETPWAISGVAGASLVHRVVEPADVLLLTTEDGLGRWTRRLHAEPSSDRGLLRIAVLRDDFPLGLARRERDIFVADPVQLWLDTSNVGERALEANEAIARMMGW